MSQYQLLETLKILVIYYPTNTAIAGLASNTRGIFQGGSNPNTNVIQFITISSLGNAQDFGDGLKQCGYSAALSNQVRGVVGGGGDFYKCY